MAHWPNNAKLLICNMRLSIAINDSEFCRQAA